MRGKNRWKNLQHLGSFGPRIRHLPQTLFKKSHELLAEFAPGNMLQIGVTEWLPLAIFVEFGDFDVIPHFVYRRITGNTSANSALGDGDREHKLAASTFGAFYPNLASVLLNNLFCDR